MYSNAVIDVKWDRLRLLPYKINGKNNMIEGLNTPRNTFLVI